MVFAPRRLLRVAKQIRPGDMMVMALFGAAHAAEKFFCPIRTSAVEAIGFFVIDALHFVSGVQRIPRAAFVRIDYGSLGDARADE